MASKTALNFSPLVRGRVHLLARHLLARTRSHVLVPFSPADAVPLWCVVFCGVPGHTHLTGLCRLVEPLRCMSHGQIVEYPYVHSSSLDEYEQWRQLLGLRLSPRQLGALWRYLYSPSTRKQILWRSAAVTFASRQTAQAAAAAAVEAELAAELAAEDHFEDHLAAFGNGSSTATCASQQEPPLLQSPPVTQPSPPPRSGDSCDQSLLQVSPPAKQPGLGFGCVDVDGTVCEVATVCEELLSNLPDDWHDFSA